MIKTRLSAIIFICSLLLTALLSFEKIVAKKSSPPPVQNAEIQVEDKVPVRGAVLGSMVDEVFKNLVPLTITTDEGEMALIDVQYCIQGKPKLIGIIVPKSQITADFKPTSFIECTQSISELGKKAKPSYPNSNWLAAVTINLVWDQWKLKFQIDDVFIIGEENLSTNKPSSSPLIKLKENKQELYSINIDDIKINIEDSAPISYKLAISFQNDRINIFGFNSTADVDVASDTVGKSIEMKNLPEYTNFVLAVNDRHINNVSNAFFNNALMPIRTGSNTKDSLVISSFSISCAENEMKSSAIVSRKGESQKFNGTAIWKGDDLSLSTIEVSPVLDDCGEKPPRRRVKDRINWEACKAKNSALVASTQPLSSYIQTKYEGQKLRPVKPSRPIKITFNNHTSEVSVITLNTRSVNNNFLVFLNTLITQNEK